MKQPHLLRWIEAAEARSVCLWAEEDPWQPTLHPMQSAQPFHAVLTSLREQLCLGETADRLSRF